MILRQYHSVVNGLLHHFGEELRHNTDSLGRPMAIVRLIKNIHSIPSQRIVERQNVNGVDPCRFCQGNELREFFRLTWPGYERKIDRGLVGDGRKNKMNATRAKIAIVTLESLLCESANHG